MALIIEDGSGVTGANSYIDAAGARAYATARGVTLDPSDAVVEAQLINAMDYLEGLNYKGSPVSVTQALEWPRKNTVYAFDPTTPFPSNQIPVSLVDAQCQLVIEQANGIDIEPTVAGNGGVAGAIIEDKVDVLTTRYSDKIGTTSEPIMPKVNALLRGLVVPSFLKTVRV